MLRGVRQGCPASGYLFTMAFDPVFRWLLSSAIPPEGCRPWFLQRCACAYADDFVLAAASLRESLPIVAGAFAIIDRVTVMSHNYHKCHWIQYANLTSPQLAEMVGTHVPYFQPMQVSDHAKHLGVVIGPGAPAHRCAKARHKFNIACAPIRASSQSLVQRLGPSKNYALSVLAFVGSISEPDKETVPAENLALQRLLTGPVSHIFPSSLLRRGSGCGHEMYVDDSQLTSKAARFRFAAKDHCDRTLDSFAASWDERYFRSSTAYFTTSGFPAG